MVEKFPTPLKGVPLGELAANVVSRLRGYPRSVAANAVSRHDPTREIITPRENAGFAERPHRGHNTSRA